MIGRLPLKVLEVQPLTGTAASVRLPESGNMADVPGMTGARHLVILIQGHSTHTDALVNVEMQLNGDTGSNYDYQQANHITTSPSGNRLGGQDSIHVGMTVGTGGSQDDPTDTHIFIPLAFESDNDIGSLSYSGAHEDYGRYVVGRWDDSSQSAITSLIVFPSAGSWNAKTVVKLCVVDETQLIDDVDLGSTGVLSVASIGSTFGDIVCVGSLQGSASYSNANLNMLFNNDTTVTNYHEQHMQAFGTAAAADTANTARVGITTAASGTANAFAPFLGTIHRYADTDDDPSVTSISGVINSGSDGGVRLMHMHRNNVEAINRVDLVVDASPATFSAESYMGIYKAKASHVLETVPVEAGAETDTILFTLSEYTVPSGSDLRVTLYGRGDQDAAGTACDIYFNGDTTYANYDNAFLYGSGTSLNSYSSAENPYFGSVPAASEGGDRFGGASALILEHDKADRHKIFLSQYGTAEGNQMGFNSCRWENDAAITSVTIFLRVGDFIAGTFAVLEAITPDGWTGTVMGVANPGKVMGVERANIGKIMGVA